MNEHLWVLGFTFGTLKASFNPHDNPQGGRDYICIADEELDAWKSKGRGAHPITQVAELGFESLPGWMQVCQMKGEICLLGPLRGHLIQYPIIKNWETGGLQNLNM